MYKNNLRKIAQGALLFLAVLSTSKNSFALTAEHVFTCYSVTCKECSILISDDSMGCNCGKGTGKCGSKVTGIIVFDGGARVSLVQNQQDRAQKALSPKAAQSVLVEMKTQLPGLFENPNTTAVVEVNGAVFLAEISSDIYFNTLKSLSPQDKQGIAQVEQKEYENLLTTQPLKVTGCKCNSAYENVSGECHFTNLVYGGKTCSGCQSCQVTFGRPAGDPTGGNDATSCESTPVAF